MAASFSQEDEALNRHGILLVETRLLLHRCHDVDDVDETCRSRRASNEKRSDTGGAEVAFPAVLPSMDLYGFQHAC